ncbi:ankyrin repeat-containing domain protein [Lactarius hatsudake]|nr:ankyrin repeat-containing domain protein [Lactarius hatsudake]
MLKDIAPQPVYIIVDALDECPGMSGMPAPRETVLDLVEDLTHLQLPFLHLCITSRPEADIREDILDYVKAVVSSDRKMRKWRDEEKKLVVEELSNKVDGMFRWAFCQLEVLRHCLPASIRSTLDQLPDTLDETYARVLSQIPQASQAHAHRLLQCLMVAVRPLRVEELAEVLAFEFDAAQGAIPRYRAGWQLNDQEHAVLSTCSSLIAIVDNYGSRVVQFSHFSVKEFLTSDRLKSSSGDLSRYRIDPISAHTIVAKACLGLFLHLDGHIDRQSVKGFPLAEYASHNWATHSRFEDVASYVEDGIKSLFDRNKPHFATWQQICQIVNGPYQALPSITSLHLSSLCGFSNLVEDFAMEHPDHVNAIDIDSRRDQDMFPLLAALFEKHIMAADVLVKHGANVNIWGMGERTIRDADIWRIRHFQGVPSLVFRNVDTMQFLLDHGADVNHRRYDLRTPLHLAVSHEGLEGARVLLERGADVNSQDDEGKTPLFLIPRTGALGLAQLLLTYGADVNRRDEDNNTPLHLAMSEHNYELAWILLEHGADPSVENDERKTPLELLFESYVEHVHTEASDKVDNDSDNDSDDNDIDDNDNDCEANGGSRIDIINITRCSLERHVTRRADMNTRPMNRNPNWTPLQVAAFTGRLAIARVLLDYGANPDVEDEDGSTLLHLVCERDQLSEGHRSQENDVGIVRLLLKFGVDANVRTKDKTTPLHLVAQNGGPKIARVLIDHGANVDAKNDEGETPLYLASGSRYHVAHLLLKRGAEVNARTKNKATPLHSAATDRYGPEIVQMLLGHGADPDAKNDKGETPLILALQSYSESVEIARLLLEHKVDVNVQTNNKTTPLHSLAALSGRLEIARMLLDQGADPDAKNDEGRDPIDPCVTKPLRVC